MNAKSLHDKRLSIWFDYLKPSQRKALSNAGYFYLELELVPWEVIYKITTSEKVLLKLRELKLNTVRLLQ